MEAGGINCFIPAMIIPSCFGRSVNIASKKMMNRTLLLGLLLGCWMGAKSQSLEPVGKKYYNINEA